MWMLVVLLLFLVCAVYLVSVLSDVGVGGVGDISSGGICAGSDVKISFVDLWIAFAGAGLWFWFYEVRQ